MEEAPPPPGYEYEDVFENGEMKKVLVPVVERGVAPVTAATPGVAAPAPSGKRGRRAAVAATAAVTGSGKRRGRPPKKKDEEEARAGDDDEGDSFEPEPEPEGRSRKVRKRKMRTVLPTVVGSAKEEACGAALGRWAGSCVPRLFWSVLRKYAQQRM